MMRSISIIKFLLFLFVLITPISSSFYSANDNITFHEAKNEEMETISIALYDSISPSVNLLERAFNYEWESNGKRYELTVERIDNNDVLGGRLANYDVFVMGASGRQYFHAITEKWKEEVKNFIYNGGGYLGICGGANIVSKGIEHPRFMLDLLINKASLGIVNVYLNDDQDGEWQYLWKDTGEDHIPLKTWIDKNCTIFKGYEGKSRFITYGGGPGMYPANESANEIKPIAIYLEEPMDVAPLHYWKWMGEWKISGNVTTDIKKQWAGIEARYGQGKMIIFGHHPEVPPMMNGSVTEFFGFSIYGIPRYVYKWEGGEQKSMDYNWWILRRSVAYVAGLPEESLPPIE
ncbi:hypothetical protein B6U81_04765 [Thermoplasmatales archaeon ex4484_30]|nr:MAG: hypothetical protein B6U81_04765 [Thermoplasmatales archaeon ex4484_30]